MPDEVQHLGQIVDRSLMSMLLNGAIPIVVHVDIFRQAKKHC